MCALACGLLITLITINQHSSSERIVVLAGAARASSHNISFLEGPKAALVNSVDFQDGQYQEPAVRGTGAFGRVYSTWALSSSCLDRSPEEVRHRVSSNRGRENDWDEALHFGC